MRNRTWTAPLLATALALVGVTAVAGAPSTQAATGQVCVQVVVDFGALVTGGPVSTTCVSVPVGSTGAQVLAARAAKLGKTAPRYNPAGLLCAIDGVPATGCAGSAPGGGARYWSYWHKQNDGDWVYSSAGAFSYTVNGGLPGEGWAWIDGGAEGSRTPATVSYLTSCAIVLGSKPAVSPAYTTPATQPTTNRRVPAVPPRPRW